MRTRSGTSYNAILTKSKKIKRKNAKLGKESSPKRLMNVRDIRQLQRANILNQVLNEAAQHALPDSDTDSENVIENRTATKMSDHLTKVGQLKLEGNLSENWRRFKRNFDIFMAAGELTQKADAIKVNTFLNAVGEEAVEIFDSFNLTDEQRLVYADVVKSFADFCEPKKNTVYERYVFSQRQQKIGEPFDNFLIEIRRLVRTCEYGNMENEMLRDRIVQGINQQRLQRELLGTANLTYDLAVSKCRSHEATNEQTSSMNKTVAVNQIEEKDNTKRNTQNRKHNNKKQQASSNTDTRQEKRGQQQQQQQRQTNNTQHRNNSNGNSSSMNNRDKSEKSILNCRYCGLSHKLRECPAYGKTCTSCSRKNHFRAVCQSKNVSAISTYDSSDNEEFFVTSIEKVYAIGDDDEVGYPWIEQICIDGRKVAFKIDTGAQINVLPLNVYNRLDTKIELHRTNTKLRAFSGDKVKPIGMCSLFGRFENMSCEMKTAVVDIDIMPILGLQSSIDFGLVAPSAHSRTNISRTFTNSSFKRKQL